MLLVTFSGGLIRWMWLTLVKEDMRLFGAFEELRVKTSRI
jgi:hypothetical protein